MYGIYANIWGILMVNVTIYIAYIDHLHTSNTTGPDGTTVVQTTSTPAFFQLSRRT